MTVSPLVWIITIIAIVGLLVFDYVFHVRKAHIPTLREAAVWSSIYVGIALLFGIVVILLGGGHAGVEYYSGWITEKALSVDNLFVFLVIMASFKVPREDQQKVLLFGITFAIISRTALILVGAAAIEHFAWAFYFFGAILLFTAVNMLRGELKDESGEEEEKDNIVVRIVKRIFPTSGEYDGDRFFTVVDGRRMLTPMLLVMIAIGGTDVLFALDSVPAIFGLTQSTYIVFTATVFSLLGLRQLYFLIDGLLDRLVYLSWGLSIILAFIGVKLVLHALHENELGIINGGQPVPVPEVSTPVSLAVIVGVLTITVIASLFSKRGKAQAAVSDARWEAEHYIEMSYQAFEARRDAIYQRMIEHEQIIENLPSTFQNHVDDERGLRELLADAHAIHEVRLAHNERGERSDEQPEGLRVVREDGTVSVDGSNKLVLIGQEDQAEGGITTQESRVAKPGR
ncbi:TerC family protein [Brachybacterium squillarum]|uniref:TerC family protein n=1 Tax=Brachybacterium squillarum TaxID=661979 RepID=UPI000262A20A|nr:TerC family protein [Brachybacterium squillarum]